MFFQLLSTHSRPDTQQNGKLAEFPGARAPFVNEIKFINENSYDPIPIYRVMDGNGAIIDKNEEPNLDKDVLVNMYKSMVQLSQMDKILYESQR
jgi:2-oxoisovalerate dehydrogenase E1 component alpha subunit